METNKKWTRKELKEKAKSTLKVFYWKLVLIAAIMTMVAGVGSGLGDNIQMFFENGSQAAQEEGQKEKKEAKKLVSEAEGKKFIVEFSTKYWWKSTIVLMAVFAFLMLSFLAFLYKFALSTFLINPMVVGVQRIYTGCFDGRFHFKDVFYGFENRYKNIVCVMLVRDLYTILWFLAFIIPGIVKVYEYKMVPYLLADNPDITVKEAFDISRQMTYGHKKDMFLLDVSFIGWHIAGIATFGIAGILFGNPYRELTYASLYRRLRGLDEIPQNVYYDGMTEL